jgi:hypothetical protein
MAVTAGAVVPLDARRRRRHDLLAELREVDHWRRLVTARLDLAVAAVTAIDDPTHRRAHPEPGAWNQRIIAHEGSTPLPAGLREILGLPVCDPALPDAALPEAALLLRLRAAQRDLDEYARALRAAADLSAVEVSTLADLGRHRRATRSPRDDRARHLQAVAGPDLPFVTTSAIIELTPAAGTGLPSAAGTGLPSAAGTGLPSGTGTALPSTTGTGLPSEAENSLPGGPTVPGGTARSTDRTP